LLRPDFVGTRNDKLVFEISSDFVTNRPPNPPKTKLIQTRHCFCGGEGPLGHNLAKVMAFYLYATLLTMSVLPDTSNTHFVNVVYFFGLMWYHISYYG
jgi:hypothetical protein